MAQFFQPKKPKLNTKHQQILVEKLDDHGAGIGYMSGKPVFIDGALPKEKVVVQLTEDKKKYARAKLIKLLEPSVQRETAFCQYYSECGGCNLQHLQHASQIDYKQESLSHLMKVPSSTCAELHPAITSSDKGYRRRARISVFYNKKNSTLQFGFRKKSSSQIANVTDCAVLDPDLNALLPKIKGALSQFQNKESLGHIELVKADNGIVLLVRHTKPLTNKDLSLLNKLVENEQLSLYLAPSSGKLDKVIGAQPYYQEANCELAFSPDSFIQVNQDINQKMVGQAIEWLDIKEQDNVLDLFCGVGNFSLPIAKVAKQVVGVEGVPAMVEQAKANAQRNLLTNAKFFHANLEENVNAAEWSKEKFDKILLDPARAGASGIVDSIGKLGASMVVYVSCNPATLARDSQALYQQGYQLKKLGMLDMFPHTSHLESMALFVKNNT